LRRGLSDGWPGYPEGTRPNGVPDQKESQMYIGIGTAIIIVILLIILL
jgi:hypothetical protein